MDYAIRAHEVSIRLIYELKMQTGSITKTGFFTETQAVQDCDFALLKSPDSPGYPELHRCVDIFRGVLDSQVVVVEHKSYQ